MKPMRHGRDAEPAKPRRPASVLFRQYWRHARGSRWLLVAGQDLRRDEEHPDAPPTPS